MKTEKRTVGDNNASWSRWIATMIIGIVGGSLIGVFLYTFLLMLPAFSEGGSLYYEVDFIQTMCVFTAIFLMLVLCLKVICKTSLHTFLFGKNRKPEYKTVLIAGGLFMAGLLISEIPSIRTISLNDQRASVILTNLVLTLLFLWMQTTSEEILFRGIFLRAPYANDVPKPLKGLGFAIFSSLLFMSLHMYNPEVLNMSGLELAAGAGSYFFTGFFMYLSNLLIEGMEAGLIFHYLNNFFCFVLVSEKVTAVPTPAIFIDYGESTGVGALMSVLVSYALPTLYLIRCYRRKNKAESYDFLREK